MPLHRKLYINQYGSNLDPRIMEQGASSDFLEKFLIRDLISRMKQVIRLAVLIPRVPILTLPFPMCLR